MGSSFRFFSQIELGDEALVTFWDSEPERDAALAASHREMPMRQELEMHAQVHPV